MPTTPNTDGTSILHVGLNPVTGPWSVIRVLARQQEKSGLYAGVGVAIISYRGWPSEYVDDLSLFRPFAYQSSTPKVFGTASFLLQLIIKPPIEKWIKDLAKRTKVKHVVVHFHNAWLSGVFVPLQVSGLTISTLTTFHGIAGAAMLEKQPLRLLIHRLIARRLLLHGSVLTSVDCVNLPKAEKLFGLFADQFHVVPNGLPAQTLTPRLKTVQPGVLTVAHVGTLNPDKGWRIVTDAVLALHKKGVDIKLLLAGSGPEEEEAALLAKENNDCINFLGYVCAPLNNVFPKVDVFVLMTENDGLPMAIIEALSCGIPVVSTRIGGIPSAVIDRISGRLIDRNSLELGKVLQEMYEMPGCLAVLSEGALAVFKQNFELGAIVKEYDKIYHSQGGS